MSTCIDNSSMFIDLGINSFLSACISWTFDDAHDDDDYNDDNESTSENWQHPNKPHSKAFGTTVRIFALVFVATLFATFSVFTAICKFRYASGYAQAFTYLYWKANAASAAYGAAFTVGLATFSKFIADAIESLDNLIMSSGGCNQLWFCICFGLNLSKG